MKMLTQLSKDELMAAASAWAPSRLVVEVAATGRMPVPNFAASGIAAPADAALCMTLGAEAVFVGPASSSDDPKRAPRHRDDHPLARRRGASTRRALGSSMKGIEAARLAEGRSSDARLVSVKREATAAGGASPSSPSGD
jgi:pyridoxal 5'-phosphate synthase pdxS subunit